ncbi:hypothetical protein BBJ28_00024848 [Nothophytophthora sp. Chile5]|nr:hypothetical protein BBJ28_00024848 [Nothophytophthora sp. Chile5]
MGGPPPPEVPASTWAARYFEYQKKHRSKQRTRIGPTVIGACLAIGGRIVVAPLLLLLIFSSTKYLNGGTFFIEADDSYFAYNQRDLVMTGGCIGCHIPCRRALHQLNSFNHEALKSKPMFEDLYTETSWDYSELSDEALAFGDALDGSGAICTGGVNEWGSPNTVVTASAEELLKVITVLQLSVAPQMIAEVTKGVEQKDECVTKWAIIALIHLFQFQTVKNSADYSSIPAADFNVFPEYTECRPIISNDNIIGSKLALATNGEDLLAVVPDLLKQFPYGFTSSLPSVSRSMAASNTMYPAIHTVVQSLFRAYYGGCRVREVNTTGVYIEDTCTIIKRWETYGLMVQSPDDIPVCSVTNVCVHNYYNSLWEWISVVDPNVEGRIAVYINVFRNRYADTVALSVLPGMVVLQMLLMGLISMYQIMSHKRSVLLTQIWAYRCQNGRMQVVYLAQITYHLVVNSDIYYLGLATGTLTPESMANLTFSFFVFSYTYINLAKARSGEQQLDRHFRLTWETMQIIITSCVATALLIVRVTSLTFIVDWNGELLRKTTSRGAKYCKLNDSCILTKVNLAIVIALLSTVLGLVALSTSYIVQKRSKHWENIKSLTSSISRRTSSLYAVRVASRRTSQPLTAQIAVVGSGPKPDTDSSDPLSTLTTFERHCLGSPFTRLFKDCDDFAYVTFVGKRCTTVEARLLTGYLFYGQHIYQAPSVVLLLLARLIPRKVLRTFNVLLIRWRMDVDEGTLTHALSCTWYSASAENYKLSEATPVS